MAEEKISAVRVERLRSAPDARGDVFEPLDNDRMTDLAIPAGEAWRFTFPPGIVHAFQNTGDAPLLIVSINTTAHDPSHSDTVRDVIL